MRQITNARDDLWIRLERQIGPGRASALRTLCQDVAEAGGRALLLGGCVRDAALGYPPRDLDLEVFRVPPGRLRALVVARFRAEVVGRHFPVLHLPGLGIDVSVPRRRIAPALGAPDFDAGAEPEVTVAEAAARRDFTIDAIGLDPLTSELLDPCGGGPGPPA